MHGPTWSQFLRSQAEAILACDLFTVDLADGTQAYVLAVVEHATRRIRILGVTLHPTGEWTAQQARNLTTDLGDPEPVQFMIRDRGSNFTTAFDAILADSAIRTVLCNVRTPRMNAIAERWIGACRRELLDRTLIWNQAHLRRILREYEIHHNHHRPHRSLHGAAPLKPLPEPVNLDHYRVRKQAHVGSLINEYRLLDNVDEVFGTHTSPLSATPAHRRCRPPESRGAPSSLTGGRDGGASCKLSPPGPGRGRTRPAWPPVAWPIVPLWPATPTTSNVWPPPGMHSRRSACIRPRMSLCS